MRLLSLLIVFSIATSLKAAGTGRDSLAVVSDSTRSDTARSTITIRSAIENARVVLDAIDLGATPVINYSLTAGTHILTVHSSELWNCFTTSIIETITVRQSENIERMVSFPHSFTVNSDPYGARVWYNDSLVGTTPVQFIPPATGSIRLSKEGYRDFYSSLPVGGEGSVHAVLEPFKPVGGGQSPLLRSMPQTSHSVCIATSAAVMSGVAAVYFKISADKLYRDYQQTGDGTTLQHVKRLDVAAGVSLVVSEISIFMLYSLLLSQ